MDQNELKLFEKWSKSIQIDEKWENIKLRKKGA